MRPRGEGTTDGAFGGTDVSLLATLGISTQATLRRPRTEFTGISDNELIRYFSFAPFQQACPADLGLAATYSGTRPAPAITQIVIVTNGLEVFTPRTDTEA